MVDRDADGVDDRVQTPPDQTPPGQQPAETGVVAPVPAEAPAVRVRGRTSMAATLAMVLCLSGLYAALTGRLAPIGIVLSVLGLLLAFGGVRASRPAVADRATFDRLTGEGARGPGRAPVRTIGRRAVTGGGLASFALLVSVAGIVVAVLAFNHTTTWLDSEVDQVSRVRDWLDTQLPWLSGW